MGRPSMDSPVHISSTRWLLLLGVDGLLLVTLWYEHLHPRSAQFALGSLLATFVTINAWVAGLRWAWLTWRVHKVFGSSIRHLPSPLPPTTYRLASGFGDLLILLTLLWTRQFWLAAAYGLCALGVQIAHCLLSRWRKKPSGLSTL